MHAHSLEGTLPSSLKYENHCTVVLTSIKCLPDVTFHQKNKYEKKIQNLGRDVKSN
jgi:hypothetical protein